MELDSEIRSRVATTPGGVPSFQPNFGAVIKRARVRRIRRQGFAVAVTLLLLAGVGLPLALLSGLGDRSPDLGAPSPPGGRAIVGAIGEVIAIPSGAVDIAEGDGVVWVSGFGRMSRVDPAGGEIVATVETPGVEDFSQVAVGFGSVWVTADGGLLYRIDANANRVVAEIDVGGDITGVVTGEGSVWVTRLTEADGELVRVDPATDRVTGSPIRVGPGPLSVVHAFGALWVTNTSPPSVDRVDPSTGAVTRLRVDGLAAAGDGSMWGASSHSTIVRRVDPSSGEVTAQIPVARAFTVAFADGYVWVLANPESSSPTLFEPIAGTAAVWQIDPVENVIVGEPLLLDALQPIALAAGEGALWVADYSGGTITRVDLLPCVHQPGC